MSALRSVPPVLRRKPPGSGPGAVRPRPPPAKPTRKPSGDFSTSSIEQLNNGLCFLVKEELPAIIRSLQTKPPVPYWSVITR